jgi:hypothetical protein
LFHNDETEEEEIKEIKEIKEEKDGERWRERERERQMHSFLFLSLSFLLLLPFSLLIKNSHSNMSPRTNLVECDSTLPRDLIVANNPIVPG